MFIAILRNSNPAGESALATHSVFCCALLCRCTDAHTFALADVQGGHSGGLTALHVHQCAHLCVSEQSHSALSVSSYTNFYINNKQNKTNSIVKCK